MVSSETKPLNENNMHADPSLDSVQKGNPLEGFPAAAQRLLELKIKRPGGTTENVIKEIILPSAMDQQRLAEVEGFVATIVAGMDNPLKERLVTSQMETITDFLSSPMIIDIFDKHQTGNEEDEAKMGRREWRMKILSTTDVEAFDYYETNALRGSSAVNATLNAIAFLNAAGQPPTAEGRAVLSRWTRGAEDIIEMLKGKADPSQVEEGDDAQMQQIRALVASTGGYDSLSSAQKTGVVRLIRQFVYGALKELAPYYEV